MLNKRIVLSLGLFLSVQAHAGDANRAFAAAQGGDFYTALTEWTPLAEQGFARAQYNVGVMYEMGEGVAKDPMQRSNFTRWPPNRDMYSRNTIWR